MRPLNAPRLFHARRAAWPAILILAILMPNVRASAGAVAEPTYYGQIVRMMQNKCIKCHHAGGVGATDYQDYNTALFYAGQIKSQVLARTMPPWNASPEPSQGFPMGQGFLPNNELTADQITLMETWVNAGAPAGDPADAPPVLVFDDSWIQGEPDVILEMPVSWAHPLGPDRYRCFLVEPTVPGALDGDPVIIGFEAKPSNLTIAHHAVVYIADRAEAEALQDDDDFTVDFDDGYDCFGGSGVSGVVLQGWAPGGNTVPLLDENLGVQFDSTKVIINQMHYHNEVGNPQSDQTQIGLKLAPDPLPPSVRLVHNFLPTHLPGLVLPIELPDFPAPRPQSNPCFSGPVTGRTLEGLSGYGFMMPGETNTWKMSVPIDTNVHLISVFPHLHLTGSAFNVTATLPGRAAPIPIINLDKWDFDWQLAYVFKLPIALPVNSTLDITGSYFNDTGGPVIGGLFSNEEMLTLGLSVTYDSEGGIPAPKDSTPPQVVGVPEVLLGPSSMMLVVDFDEDITVPHYPSGFEITGPGGRVAPPTSIDASTGMLVIDYDPLLLFPIANAWVDFSAGTPVSHGLLLNGFFGIKDLNENFLDGDGDGVANEISGAVSPDDVTFNFSWSGPELGTPADPFSTLEGALLAVGDGDTLRIVSGSTGETLTINQSVTLVADAGLVRIGGV